MRFSALKEAKETMMLVDLPYELGDLSPVMSRETVNLHYNVLSRGYVDRFNNREGDPEFNRAGALLHNLFWAQFTKPKINNQPNGISKELIERIHGDFVDFRDAVVETAMKFQGSGWVYMDKNGSIKTLVNQTWKSDIILPLDIWEHSYLLDYASDRKSYIRNIFRCINWTVINDRLTVGL